MEVPYRCDFLRDIETSWVKGTVSLCNNLISEKKKKAWKSIISMKIVIAFWLYQSRNKMTWIPEMGGQCYALIDAMFIEAM